jgi:predicted enzyme related to lactoylglutathione lyase
MGGKQTIPHDLAVMKKNWVSYGLVAGIAFLLGSSTGWSELNESNRVADSHPDLARVTGIGGIFFRSPDPSATRDWYRTHLGIDAADWGGFAFQWREKENADEVGYTVWGVFPDSTGYFGSGTQSYMLNYRVADLNRLVESLREEDVSIVGEIEQHPNGKFAWIMDPDGRRIELWEPVPSSQDPYLE